MLGAWSSNTDKIMFSVRPSQEYRMSRHLAHTLTEAFWQPSIWLPPNSTWSDIEMPRKAQFGHLAYPLPMAFILMVVRFFLDRALYRYLPIDA